MLLYLVICSSVMSRYYIFRIRKFHYFIFNCCRPFIEICIFKNYQALCFQYFSPGIRCINFSASAPDYNVILCLPFSRIVHFKCVFSNCKSCVRFEIKLRLISFFSLQRSNVCFEVNVFVP